MFFAELLVLSSLAAEKLPDVASELIWLCVCLLAFLGWIWANLCVSQACSCCRRPRHSSPAHSNSRNRSTTTTTTTRRRNNNQVLELLGSTCKFVVTASCAHTFLLLRPVRDFPMPAAKLVMLSFVPIRIGAWIGRILRGHSLLQKSRLIRQAISVPILIMFLVATASMLKTAASLKKLNTLWLSFGLAAPSWIDVLALVFVGASGLAKVQSRFPMLAKVIIKILIGSKASDNENRSHAEPSKGIVGLDHVLLNLDMNEVSHWGNLGLWPAVRASVNENDTIESSYPQACNRLANALAEMAGIFEDNTAILDVGSGCGDQIGTWLARQPTARVVAINPVSLQNQMARRRWNDHKNVWICTGSATQQSEALQSIHHQQSEEKGMNDAEPAPTLFNRILALDCAYHFQSRGDFFRQSRDRAAPCARIAVSDVVLGRTASSSPWKRWIMRKAASSFGVPACNLKTPDEYRQELQECGFGMEIEVRSIGALVFPGYKRFIERHIDGINASGLPIAPARWTKFKVAGSFFHWLWVNHWIDYVIVGAQASPNIK